MEPMSERMKWIYFKYRFSRFCFVDGHSKFIASVSPTHLTTNIRRDKNRVTVKATEQKQTESFKNVRHFFFFFR